ncbi:MAG TPA: PPK2 family polyphosphate kinase, partial [Candidatus Acidoferrales bacterium]|nr:PPK2 family polyphosphate kinase [Candidatus Acidoferrales bacterium]
MKHKHLRVRPGAPVRLSEIDPTDTNGLQKGDASEMHAQNLDKVEQLQEKLAASRSYAVLIVLQGMDSSGKDGAIKHVMSGVNPQGVDVHAFKQPTENELSHDFLWRTQAALPERGRIGIFNRSYYEEVLVVRVHSELLAREHVESNGKDIWRERFEDINAFERHLVRNGTRILKFFLHISKDEQRRRLMARLDDPSKTWKFSMSDATEREYWSQYISAYEAMLSATSTDHAPWYIIPSDHKWF